MVQINRFNAWSILAASSLISIFVLDDQGAWKDIGSKGNFAIACCSISFVVALFMVGSHFSVSLSLATIGTKFEAVAACSLMGFWVAGTLIIQDSKNMLANWNGPGTNKNNMIRNANLYFFNWACFFVTGFLTITTLKQASVYDVQDVVAALSPRLHKWYMILVASVVILIESADLKSGACSDICWDGVSTGCYQASTCRATNYAISIGVIVGTVSFIAIGLTQTNRMFLFIDSILSTIALIFYTFGTGFITAENGPGNAIGNLYFTTWGGFIASFMLVSLCVKEYNEGRMNLTVTETNETSKEEETQVNVEEPVGTAVTNNPPKDVEDVDL